MLRGVLLDRLATSDLPLPAREWRQLSEWLDQAILRATNRSIEARERTQDAIDHFTTNTAGLLRLEDFLEGLLRALREAAPGIDFVAVLLLREDNILQGHAEVGLGAKSWLERQRQIGEGFTGRVAEERHPLEIRTGDQLRASDRAVLRETRARALYGVPLFHAERLIGVATIGSRKGDGFSREEKLLFRALASRVSALLVEARLQEQRRQSEELLRTVLDAAPALIQVKDLSGRYLRVNRAWADNYGLQPVVGKTPFDALPRHLAEAMLQDDRTVLAAGEPREFEHTLVTPDGRERAYLTLKYPLHDAEGRPWAVAGISTDITARQHAEAEKAVWLARERFAHAQAEESRLLLDTFMQSATVGFALADRELRFRFVNQAYARANNRPVVEHLGRTVREMNPGLPTAVDDALREVLQTGRPLLRRTMSSAVVASPGQFAHWMVDLFPVRTIEGEIFGVGAVATDITVLRDAQAENERLLALLRAVLDQMPGGVIIAEAPSTNVLLANRQNEAQTGVPFVRDTARADLCDLIGQCHHLDGSPLSLEEDPLSQVLCHGLPRAAAEILFQQPGGTARHLEITAAGVHGEDGALVAGVRVALDVTEQRAAEERARFLGRVTETLTSSLDDETTLTRLAELAVPQLADWCSIHTLEEGGVRCLAIRHRDPGRTPVLREILESEPLTPLNSEEFGTVLRTGKSRLVEEVADAELVRIAANEWQLQLLREAGLQSALLIPLVARGETIGVLSLAMADSGRRFTPVEQEFAQEVVRRAALALDNSRLYREAQEAVRLREDVLAMASHDLRSPLNALQLRVQALLRTARTQESLPQAFLEEALTKMQHQGTRLQQLVDTLLDVSRIEGGSRALEPQEVELVSLAHAMIERHADLLRSAGCEPSVTGGPVRVRCDRVRLERVLSNLLTNAAKYGGGEPVEITVRRDSQTAELRVMDSGIGISAADLPKLFRRFSRVGESAAFPGTGLGLWIAHSMLASMGGSIRAEPREVRGVSFVVTLPLGNVATLVGGSGE